MNYFIRDRYLTLPHPKCRRRRLFDMDVDIVPPDQAKSLFSTTIEVTRTHVVWVEDDVYKMREPAAVVPTSLIEISETHRT